MYYIAYMYLGIMALFVMSVNTFATAVHATQWKLDLSFVRGTRKAW